MSSTYRAKCAIFFALCMFGPAQHSFTYCASSWVSWVIARSFHSRRKFHSGRRDKGTGAKLSVSPLAGCVYAYSKLQAYKSLSLCYRLNYAINITETETFPVCWFVQGFRPRLPASASPNGYAAIPAMGRSQGLHRVRSCSAFWVAQYCYTCCASSPFCQRDIVALVTP